MVWENQRSSALPETSPVAQAVLYPFEMDLRQSLRSKEVGVDIMCSGDDRGHLLLMMRASLRPQVVATQSSPCGCQITRITRIVVNSTDS